MGHQYLLGKEENLAADEFFNKHRCKQGMQRQLQLTVSHTGIAYHIEAKCVACGKIKDVTCYDNW